MNKDEILMAMEMTARAERQQGFLGYGKPPDEYQDMCRELVDDGLAEEHKFHPGWFRPTKQGADRVGHRISRAQ
jgi:hypothetical protein